MTFDLEKNTTKLLALLLLADCIFILLHIPHTMQIITNPLFSIGRDMGYAEVYQYIKIYWIVLLLLYIVVKRKRLIYFAWFLLFLYLLIDDTLRVHETMGRHIVSYFEYQPAFGLRAQDFGELSVSFFFGTLLFTFIAIAYLQSDNKGKQRSKHLLALVMLLAVFGVAMDMIHSMASWGSDLWGLIEDGGEMLVISIIVWYVFNIDISRKDTTPKEESQHGSIHCKE